MKINLSTCETKRYKKYLAYLIDFLKTTLVATKAQGYILGVSGGVDSSLCAYLVQQVCPDHALFLHMPCFSNKQDKQDVNLLVQKLQIKNFLTIDLKAPYQFYADQSLDLDGTDTQQKILGNLKARLRMVTLYFHGQLNNYLVVGTDNWAEYYLGYFTKYGDGAADVLPLIHLTKTDVLNLAHLVDLPPQIIEKPPSAGLWHNQTDEAELGFHYQAVDAFLQGKAIRSDVKSKILHWHHLSEHKRLPAIEPLHKLVDYE